jgi:two-component system, NarL family, invasion response regulator UvrY
MKILIADDHALIRRGLKQIVDEEFPNGVTGEAQDCREVLEMVRTDEWDIVVLDLNMPGGYGLEVLKQIKVIRPKLPVLVLSMYTEDQFGALVLREGAAGYLNKKTAPEELVKAIRKVVDGGKYVSASLAEKLAMEIDKGVEKPLHKTLSNREYQVFIMLASGKSVGEIAEDLSLSEKTVRQFRARLLLKMKMRNNVELAHYAMANKLIGS